MRREPPITFRGALQLLGVYERPLIDRLDRLLGGVILTAGALATVPALAPFAPIWGWVDQKNEATGLLRTCLDRVQFRLSKMQGYERVELVTAAHTMIVLSAAFETAREAYRVEALQALRITAAEQDRLAAGRWRGSDESLFSYLWSTEVPVPGGAVGFAENSQQVRDWVYWFGDRLLAFVNDLTDGLTDDQEKIRRYRKSGALDPLAPMNLADRAEERYHTHYLRLATTVPDFWIWAQLGEHAATRAAISEIRSEVVDHSRAAFEGQGAALFRIESLLTTITAGSPSAEAQRMTTAGSPSAGQRAALARANRDVLSLPVVRWPAFDDLSEAITFPTVEESYVNPTYRLAVADRTTRPADESWWGGQRVRNDLDLMVTTLLTTFDATRRPLLLLGHPGGGKSMLTKVLAARLPAESYTVVRVPLRQVVANAPIHDQIRQALDLSTHGRATDWFELADDARTVRIVLLDGLDELLQATTHDRSGFLNEVMEFQRVEAAQGRPVMVVVTSRTVVAERVDIPSGTPIAKLEEFDDDQIGQWLAVWNRANAAARDRVRPLTREAALAHPGLARQPLLLLMLAIYWSDPAEAVGVGELSLTSLYQRLLTSFAVREVRKKTGSHLRSPALDEATAEQLYRLSIAAIGMFNRGRQHITESELGSDLHGLDPGGGTADAESAGRRVLGEFFFVHAAEAQVRLEQREVRRCYEFLHATFGEYLIASLTVEALADMAEAAFGGTRGPRKPSDDLLFALLSHQTIASRRPILDFAGELLRQMPDEARQQIISTLDLLIQGYDRRVDARRYPGYRPLPESNLRPLAAYSANLVLLRTLFGDAVPLSALFQERLEQIDRWRSTVTLWRAGLDADGWQAMLDALALHDGTIRLRVGEAALPAEFRDVQYARLTADRDVEIQLRLGAALHGKFLYYVDGDSWVETMASWLVPAISLPAKRGPGFLLLDPPAHMAADELVTVTRLMSTALLVQAQHWSGDFVRLLVAWIHRNALLRAMDPAALAFAISTYPALLDEIPALRDPQLYGSAASRWLLWSHTGNRNNARLTTLIDEFRPVVGYPEDMLDAIGELIAGTIPSVTGTGLPNAEASSIFVIRDDGPISMGSVTGSLPEGGTFDPDSPKPEVLG